MKKNRMAMWVGLVLVTMGAAQAANAGGRPDLVIKGLKAGQPHVSGELLVKYRDGAASADRDAVVQGLGAQKLETVRRGNGRNGEIALLKLPGNVDLSAAVQVLSADPAVEYAEPNWTYQHNAVSNDTYSTNGSLWGMYGDAGTPATPLPLPPTPAMVPATCVPWSSLAPPELMLLLLPSKSQPRTSST